MTVRLVLGIVLVIASVLGAPGRLAGEDIRFSAIEATFPMTAAGEPLVARFPFTNDGSSAARILVVKPSCDCETVSLDHERFEPGESGTITVVLAIEPGPRLQRRSVRLLISGADAVDPAVRQLELSIRVVPAPDSDAASRDDRLAVEKERSGK